MRDDVLSSLARGVEGRSLVAFFGDNEIPVDWGSCPVRCEVVGHKLGNVTGDMSLDDSPDKEYLVSLVGASGSCVVNLATVLAMAAAFCRHEAREAREALELIRKRSVGD